MISARAAAPSAAAAITVKLRPIERGSQPCGELRLSAEDVFPGELVTGALALQHQLHAFRRNRKHVRLAVHVDLALQSLIELRSHGFFLALRLSESKASPRGDAGY